MQPFVTNMTCPLNIINIKGSNIKWHITNKLQNSKYDHKKGNGKIFNISNNQISLNKAAYSSWHIHLNA